MPILKPFGTAKTGHPDVADENYLQARNGLIGDLCSIVFGDIQRRVLALARQRGSYHQTGSVRLRARRRMGVFAPSVVCPNVVAIEPPCAERWRRLSLLRRGVTNALLTGVAHYWHVSIQYSHGGASLSMLALHLGAWHFSAELLQRGRAGFLYNKRGASSSLAWARVGAARARPERTSEHRGMAAAAHNDGRRRRGCFVASSAFPALGMAERRKHQFSSGARRVEPFPEHH